MQIKLSHVIVENVNTLNSVKYIGCDSLQKLEKQVNAFIKEGFHLFEKPFYNEVECEYVQVLLKYEDNIKRTEVFTPYTSTTDKPNTECEETLLSPQVIE